ncbi:MAG: hypothetical protein CM1200mP36_07630 [Gammaproteobacteria bacterium]|nr:MAG: hypothetical protein CM1200mP36_07630 [Gammaproteobacteria bacterium]
MISVMLIKLGRPARYTLIPMIFVLITQHGPQSSTDEWYQDGNWLLVTIDVIVIVTSFLVIWRQPP